MKTKRPFCANITPAMKAACESLAEGDGEQRGYFFDTSGALRCERVSATATVTWLFKTTAGKPFQWA